MTQLLARRLRLQDHVFSLTAATLFLVSLATIALFGLPSWLLVLGFCLLLLGLWFLWSSIASLSEDEPMSLQEALELAAPARDEERKLSVLRGLKDLQYEHGLGKISDDDYQALSLRYRSEARSLLESLDVSDSEAQRRVRDAVAARLETRP